MHYIKDRIRNPKKDWVRSVRASGYYPVGFNFLFSKLDRYGQCSYCGKFVPQRELTRDHVWPKSLGGNVKVPSCNPCNVIKEDKKPIEFAIFASTTGLSLASQIFEHQ